MNYKLIKDKDKLEAFVNWLPELRKGECYYFLICARNKWIRDNTELNQIVHIRSDKQQVARFIANNKASIARRIQEHETSLGNYKTKDGIEIPEEALGVYISVNPRSHIVAAKDLLKKMADTVTSEYNGYRIDQDALSCVQNAVGNKVYLDIDFDGVSLDETLKSVSTSINIDCVTVLVTRGGFHLLIKLNDIDAKYKRTWYNSITKLPGCDVKGDNLVPVPGCTQGMFIPYLRTI